MEKNKDMQHLTDDQLFDLVDEMVTSEEKLAYTGHLSFCEHCQGRYQTFTAINAQLEEMPLLTPSVVFTERVLDQWDDVRLAVIVKKQRTRLTPFVFLGFMAVLMAVCLLVLSMFSAPLPTSLPIDRSVETMKAVLGNGPLWEAILIGNALLLLWLFNQRVLSPFFRQRMSM